MANVEEKPHILSSYSGSVPSSWSEVTNESTVEGNMVNVEEMPSYSDSVPSSWWEVINKSTGIRYYWNDISNLTQYETPSCFDQLTSIGSSNIQARWPSLFPSCIFSIQTLHQHHAASQLQFPHNTNAHQPNVVYSKKRKLEPYYLNTTYSPKLTTTMPMVDDDNKKQQQEDTRVGASIQNASPRTATDLGSGLLHLYSPPAGVNIFPDTTLSGATNKSPKLAHVPALTTNAGKSLYLSFFLEEGDIHSIWYHLKIGGGEGVGTVKENDSKKVELITTLLDDVSQGLHSWGDFTVLNSSIYKIVQDNSCANSKVLVLETEAQEGLSWKELTPLLKDRIKPWAVSVGGKIYIVGAEKKCNIISRREINDIEVFTDPKSTNFESLPVHSPPKITDWLDYFVVPFEDHNKLVMGSSIEKCLILYDVCTHDLERIDLSDVFSWGPKPVVVGTMLFSFSWSGIYAYDLVERCFWRGKIDGLDLNFLRANCNDYENPDRLIYIGDGKLCLLCFRSQNETTSTLQCCVFGVPEFREEGGHRSLHGHVDYFRKFNIGPSDMLMDVLLL